MRPIQAVGKIGNFAVKHPNIYTGIVSGTNGALTGAIIGGVAGSIREDETFWSGVGKGALVGAGVYTGIGMSKMHMLAKSRDMTLSEIYGESFKQMDSLLKGLGHDGIGL